MKSLFLFLFLSCLNFACRTSNSSWPEYNIQSLDTTSFVKLSDIEQRFLNVSTDFTNNRARITLTDSGNVISPRELRTPDFPLPCFCSSTGDTVHIVMGLGMKATMGIKIDLHDGRFNAIYFHEADDAKVFKRSKGLLPGRKARSA